MWIVVLADVLLAGAAAAWLASLLRARDHQIPFVVRDRSSRAAIAGLVALVVDLLVNLLVLRAMDVSGPALDGLAFAAWLGALGVGVALFGAALGTWWTNRDAQVWIRTLEPDTLVVREPDGETRVVLGPSSVRARIVGNGLSGPAFVQYAVAHGERSLNLVVPFTLSASAAIAAAPWLASYTGPIAQGGARELNRFLARYCATEARA